MVPPDVPHRCSLVRRDVLKRRQVIANPLQIEPLWELSRGHLEQVLVKRARTTAPQVYHQASRPGEDHIAVFDNVLARNRRACPLGALRDLSSKLSNLDHRQRLRPPSREAL